MPAMPALRASRDGAGRQETADSRMQFLYDSLLDRLDSLEPGGTRSYRTARDALERGAEYRARLQHFFETRDATRFENGNLYDCVKLLSFMFRNATSVMRILSGGLNRKVYAQPELVQAALQFVGRDSTVLKILVEDSILCDDSHLLLALLADKTNVEVRCVPQNISKILHVHFAIMDEIGYRIEPDKNMLAAHAAFGDEAFCATLVRVFDLIFLRSERWWPSSPRTQIAS